MDDYRSPKSKDVRCKLEWSNAIKCPDIFLQIIGLKKFQEVLADLNVLRKFVHIEDHVQAISRHLTNFYPLNSKENIRKAIEMVQKSPYSYVLKPQREGGGNNTYNVDIVPLLTSLLSHDKITPKYQLMDMINGVTALNYSIVDSSAKVNITTMVSEIGIYGTWLYSNDKKCIVNKSSGVLIRTKPIDVNEGGISCGSGALSSLYMVCK